MDRQIVYPAQILPETTLLSMAKDSMIGLSKLAAAVLGATTTLNGLAVTPTSPASLQVYVAPGEIYSVQNTDGTAYSSLAADTTHQIVKQGILLDQATLNCPAPGTAGQSINYLIQVAYQDIDSGSTVLPYYNASNPSQAYSGPANSGTAQNTVRKGVCTVSAKAGVAATTGTQTTPAPDSGYVGAFVVTVANGQTQIIAGNISGYSGSPLLPASLLSMIQQAPAVVGTFRNLAGSAPGAAKTASWTASEIVAKSALGGISYVGASVSLSFNGATTGANGMDTGATPNSGSLHIYAVYNPTTNIWGTLGTTAGGGAAVYGGANMPAGYTASALIWSGVTNGVGQIGPFKQFDRSISIPATSVISTTATQAGYTGLNMQTVVPVNTRSIGGVLSTTGGSPSRTIYVASDNAGTGNCTFQDAGAGAQAQGSFNGLLVVTAQTIYYWFQTGGGTTTFGVSVSQYTI